jgi:hypothetical protein
VLPFLALLVLSPVQADDDDLGLLDIDDIDLGDGPAHGDVVQTSTYTGSLQERRSGLGQGKSLTITHYGGPISIRCQEGSTLSARINYSIDGTNEPNMERYGRGIKLKVWGDSNSGGVKTITPSKGSGLIRTEVPLVVSAPKSVKLTVNAGSHWVEVLKCDGQVSVANKSGDVWVEGDLTRFSISAPGGMATVKLNSDSQVTSTSKITARDDVLLEMPLDVNVKLSARGTEIRLDHVITGTESETSVSGTIGNGGPSVTIRGKAKVVITAP